MMQRVVKEFTGEAGVVNGVILDNGDRLNTYSQRYDDNRFYNNITRATNA